MIERINIHGYRVTCDRCNQTVAENGDFDATIADAAKKGARCIISSGQDELLCKECMAKLIEEVAP